MKNESFFSKNTLKSCCLLMFFVMFISILPANDWTPIGPTTQDLQIIVWHPEDENTVLGSFDNIVYVSDDYLETWRVLYAFDFEHYGLAMIRDIKFDPFDSEIIYAAVSIFSAMTLPQEGLYKSIDGGESFGQILSDRIQGMDIHPITGKIVSYSSRWDNNNIDISVNGGESWTALSNYPPNFNEIAFDSQNDNILYMTSYDGAFRTLDGGLNWDSLGLDDMSLGMCVVHPDISGELWLGGLGFGDFLFLHSTDWGETWETITIPQMSFIMDNPIKLVFGSNRDIMYVGEVNEIFVTTDGGENWTIHYFEEAQFFYTRDLTINPHNDLEVLAISDGGFIRTTDGGETWEDESLNLGATLAMVTVPDQSGGFYLYSGGPNGNRRYSSSTGEWIDFSQQHMVGLEVHSLAVDYTIPDLLLTGYHTFNFCGVIRKSMDMGESDSVVYNNVPDESGSITSIVKSPAEEGVFYGTTWSNITPGQFIRSEDWGSTWEVLEQSGATHVNFSNVMVSNRHPEIVYTFGDGGVFKSTDRAFTFTPHNEGLGGEAVVVSTMNPHDDNYILAGTPGALYKSTNGALSWEYISGNAFVKMQFHPQIPNYVIAFCQDENVLESTDAGLTWHPIENDIPAAGMTDLTFSPDGRKLFIATWSAGIHMTELDFADLTPATPQAVSSGFNVNLNWEAVSGADAYGIYRNGVRIAESSTNSFNNYYLLPGQYGYRVSTIIGGFESDLSGSAFVYIGGSDLAAPANLTAVRSGHRAVNLSWDEPTAGNSCNWIGYDDGETAGFYSPMMGGDSHIGIMFDQDDLSEYEGYLLSGIRFFAAGEFSEYILKVWNSGDISEPVLEQEVLDFTPYEWNEFMLDTPILINAIDPIYAGFHVSAFGEVASHDNGPLVYSGKSNLIATGASVSWNTLDNIGLDGIEANWNLQVFVESPEQSNSRIVLQNYLERNTTGYRVYRNGTLLEEILNPEIREFLDEGLAFSTYSYAVTALYSDGESVPSNPGIITLDSPFPAPKNLSSEITSNFEVGLTWTAPHIPETPQDIEVGYGSSTEGGTYSQFVGGSIELAVRFPAAEMVQYTGMSISGMSFNPKNMNGDYTLKIWNGLNGEELYSQPVNYFYHNEVNDFMFIDEIQIVEGMDIMIGYELSHMGNDVFAYDNTTTEYPGYSDLVKLGFGEWSTMDQALGISANNMIQMRLSSNENLIEVPVLIGYEVYRNYQLITSIYDPDIVEYLDSEIEFETNYTYSLKALYDGEEESDYSEAITVNINSPYVSPLYFSGETESSNVLLSWEMPEDVFSLKWGPGNYRNAIGAANGGNIMAAIRFNSQHLQDLDGFELRRLRIFPRESYHTNIKIYNGYNGQNLLHEQNLGFVNPWTWNEITLEQAVVIDASQGLWIAYEMTELPIGAFPVMLDGGPAVQGYGDLASLDGGLTWDVLSYFGINGNHLIQGEVVDLYGNATGLNLTGTYFDDDVEFFKQEQRSNGYNLQTIRNTDYELTGFNVYRNGDFLTFLSGDTTRVFTDLDLPNGDYSYSITAVYTNEIESAHTDTLEFTIDVTSTDGEIMPRITALGDNYPNPFNPSTKISFTLNMEQSVSLEIYNIKGQIVRVLVNEVLPAGNHNVVWNGDNDRNQSVSSGVYFYKMKTADYSAIRKMIMIK